MDDMLNDYRRDAILAGSPDDDEGERFCCECGEPIAEGETGNDVPEGLMCDSCYLAMVDEEEDMNED